MSVHVSMHMPIYVSMLMSVPVSMQMSMHMLNGVRGGAACCDARVRVYAGVHDLLHEIVEEVYGAWSSEAGEGKPNDAVGLTELSCDTPHVCTDT